MRFRRLPRWQRQGRIVGVADLGTAEQRGAVEVGQGQVFDQAAREIRVGHEGTAEGHQVGIAVFQHPLRTRLVVVAGHDDGVAETLAQLLAECFGHHRIVPVRFHQVQVGNAALLQPGGRIQDGRQDVRAIHAACGQEGRQADRGAMRTDFIGHGIDHLLQETQPVLARTAVFIGTYIGGGAQELVHQVTIGAVDFHAVETGVDGIACGAAEVLDDGLDLLAFQRTRGRAGDHAALAGGGSTFQIWPSKGSADGATGSAPSWKSGCDMRPTCHSCRKMRPSARCTAS
jgi:hypothetical protein